MDERLKVRCQGARLAKDYVERLCGGERCIWPGFRIFRLLACLFRCLPNIDVFVGPIVRFSLEPFSAIPFLRAGLPFWVFHQTLLSSIL